MHTANLAEQVANGRVLCHGPQSSRTTTGHTARLVVPPQLHCGGYLQVWSMCVHIGTFCMCVGIIWFLHDAAHVCFHRQFPRLSLSKQSMSQFQAKMLTKQVFRLMEKFNIDQGVWLSPCAVVDLWVYGSGRCERDLVFFIQDYVPMLCTRGDWTLCVSSCTKGLWR